MRSSNSSALEQREYEAVCHVKESVQIAESALLEKDQATIRERQLVNEVERLKSTMATIVKEAGERTKKEVWWCLSSLLFFLFHWSQFVYRWILSGWSVIRVLIKWERRYIGWNR